MNNPPEGSLDALPLCRWPDLPAPYMEALRQAVVYILERFEVLGIVVSGTILRGNPSPSSDLDLYVIHAHPQRQRIQKLFGDPPPSSPLPGVPAEIFVNPVCAIHRYFQEEQAGARPLTAHMLATGFVILDRDPVVEALRQQARELLAQPPQAGAQKLTYLRYMAATLYEDALDIVASDPQAAGMILARAVHEMLHYTFWKAGRFLPREKDLLCAAADIDPQLGELARRFFGATGLPEQLALAEEIAGRTIGVKGFFEWESALESVED